MGANELIVELVVTEECNLGCTYCYMENKPNYMTKERIIQFQEHVGTMMKLYQKDSYHISYFGGEPLLNWDLIKFANGRFREDPRCSSQVIISNGLLLDLEKGKWLQENQVGISLSFDGLWNNTNRPMKKGSPSFPFYQKKKDVFHELGIHNCKVMVGPASIDSLLENFNFFVDEFDFPSPDFSLVRDDIWSWKDVEIFQENLTALADETVRRFQAGKAASPGFFNLMLLDILLSAKLGKRSMGCFAGCGGVGYLPTGIFYPCARYGSEHKYPLLDVNSGELFKENVQKLLSKDICNPQAYESCKSCEIRLHCNGGCNKSFLDKGGDIKAEPIPQLCELYKAVSKETLRIHQVLRENQTYRTYIKNLVRPFLQGRSNG